MYIEQRCREVLCTGDEEQKQENLQDAVIIYTPCRPALPLNLALSQHDVYIMLDLYQKLVWSGVIQQSQYRCGGKSIHDQLILLMGHHAHRCTRKRG